MNGKSGAVDERAFEGEREGDGLIERAPGDDVIVRVRMRRSSFDKLSSTLDGRSVPVTEGMIGLVYDPPPAEDGTVVWTFVIWSGEPVWRGVEEQIPGNRAAAAVLAHQSPGDAGNP